MTPKRWTESESEVSSACGAQHECGAPIPLIALFIGFPANGMFFSVADGLDARGTNSFFDEKFFYLIGAPISQAQIVSFTASLVTVAFNGELETTMLL